MKAEDITSIDSEAGIIASLIHNPEFAFYSEHLLPNHFSKKDNSYVYAAITDLAKRGITTVDPYNILESLESSEGTRGYASALSIDKLNELMDMSDVLARDSIEEYKMLVDNVMDAAFRRDIFNQLQDCLKLCYSRNKKDVQQRIYKSIDGVMTEYSTAQDIPPYSEVIDGCYEEIKSRQGSGYAGIPFKFPTLNEYVTIEKGELVIFAAEAKQGKSMLLLNCAIDLLKKDQAVLYIDSELNTRMFTARVLSYLSGIEYKRLTSGSYSDEESAKIDKAIAWMKTRKFTHIYIPMFDQQSIYIARCVATMEKSISWKMRMGNLCGSAPTVRTGINPR